MLGHRIVTGISAIKTGRGPGEVRLDDKKIELLGVENSEVSGFDMRPLTRSAPDLANHIKLRKSSTVKAGHPVDVG